MSLIALHNGGGVGISKAINGGFGLVLDGSERIDKIINRAIAWDVLVGVARRSWARNSGAMEVAREVNENQKSDYHITLPYVPDEDLVVETVAKVFKK
jgi:urocanate hydratase